jgi:hypothetical protein
MKAPLLVEIDLDLLHDYLQANVALALGKRGISVTTRPVRKIVGRAQCIDDPVQRPLLLASTARWPFQSLAP